MTTTLTVPAIVAVVGLIVYIASDNGKAMEIGRIMFAFGLLALLLGAR